MIKIKDLTVKNFMSVGNQTQAIDFNKEQLTLVLGENLDQGGDDTGSRNGTGKTTIVNALSYALYGQALTNIKRNNLINKTNSKGMLVTLHFEKNGVDYRIERGRSPNVLKFYVNNNEQDLDESQGDSRKTQDFIDDLLNMSHDMFKHIVALNTYTEPFLNLKTNDQRAIIEQLLGITLLSEKAERLKEHIKESKLAIQEETAKINGIQAANEKIESTINNLETTQKAWDSKKRTDIAALELGIAELEKLDIEDEIESHKCLEDYNVKKQKIDEATRWIESINKDNEKLEKSLTNLERDIKMLNDHKCHACGQDLHDSQQDEIKTAKEKLLQETSLQIISNNGQHQEHLDIIKSIGELDECPTTFYPTIEEAYNHRSTVESLQKDLATKVNDKNPYTEQIEVLKNTALQEISWDVVNDLTALKDHQEFLYKLLTNKDSFIRKKIIDQNLTFLNSRLTYYLVKLGMTHQVSFQNDLSVEITQLGQDLDFDNLSRGERNRVILGMSFAFRDVWESLYQTINLLFVDELIDSGMDTAGVENSLSVLKTMTRDMKKNVFLISHKDELIGRVNYVLKVIKENGFTSYSSDIDIV